MMTTLVCFVSLATVAMLAILLPLTSSTPLGGVVEPTFALDDMAPDHACLFICNLCFTDVQRDHPLWATSLISPVFRHFLFPPEDTDKLMACSNTVCGSLMEGKCAFEKFMWLGHHCGPRYNMVEMMWSSSKHERSIKDKYHTLA